MLGRRFNGDVMFGNVMVVLARDPGGWRVLSAWGRSFSDGPQPSDKDEVSRSLREIADKLQGPVGKRRPSDSLMGELAPNPGWEHDDGLGMLWARAEEADAEGRRPAERHADKRVLSKDEACAFVDKNGRGYTSPSSGRQRPRTERGG